MRRVGWVSAFAGLVLTAAPGWATETVAHGRLTVPDHFGQGWGVFLLYRAHW